MSKIVTQFFRSTVKYKQTFVIAQRNLHSKPNFTQNNYNVKRGNYNSIEEEHISFFRSLLGENRILTDLSDLEKYNVDFFKHLRGKSQIVLKPKTTEEVSQILSFCNNNRIAVCLQGGHTGLVGGATPVFDEVVLSTELMNQIVDLDENSGVLICQAGCILEKINDYLAEKDLIFPLDLGAKGSCQIGGNISTNAGGLRVIKYGNLHGNVLGLEVVQADGEILDCLSVLKKDNTGYHLKNLFIGSEGSLGVITKAAVQCRGRPKFLNVTFLGLQNFDKVRETYKKARYDLEEIMSAFEVMDDSTMKLVNEHLGLKSPIGNYPFYVLIETSGSDEEFGVKKLNSFLETCLNKHFVLDGTVTDEPGKYKAIWDLREKIPEAMKKDGYVFIYDVSLPLRYYYQLVEEMRDYMGKLSHRVFGFGHMGDCNLHLQISVESCTPEIMKHIEPYIFEKVKSYNGSISAEHGMGFLKAKYLSLMKTPLAVQRMRQIKRLMDPNGILNPYKVIP